MQPYDRKKYVWKLVYINMLGYDVDFGHMEMIALVRQAALQRMFDVSTMTQRGYVQRAELRREAGGIPVRGGHVEEHG
jgi:hypothetical protein